MALSYKPDIQKAIEVLLYVTERVANRYNVLKVIYFADWQHLGRYGRLIYGESYFRLPYGPVPSLADDLAKETRVTTSRLDPTTAEQARACFSIDEKRIMITPLRRADVSLLSASDIECLDEAIERYGHISFDELKAVSHDDPVSIEGMATSFPDGDILLDYLRGR